LQTKIRIMKRTFFLLTILALLLSNCRTKRTNNILSVVDSLIIAEEYDSAYSLVVAKLDTMHFSSEDHAHYNLLKVQTAYLVNRPLDSSSLLLDSVISYYEQNPDCERLSDAYYYRAICAYKEKDKQGSILFYKKSEHQAQLSGNLRQQYKVAEGISFVNGRCAKFDLQLEYAKKALQLSKIVGNKKWIAYSLYRMDLAFHKLGMEDSAIHYLNQIPSYIDYFDKKDLPIFMSYIGYLLMDRHPQEAKRYLLESLSYQEFTATYEYLAEIYYEEGNTEKAYEYWKKALVVQDATPKDNIIHNIIEYDIERGKTDSICERINEIIAIRDSIDAKLRNDTIKDLQTRFDHEVEMREKDKAVIKWQWVAIALVILLLVGVIYYLVRKYQNRIQLQKYQMQIHDYMEQIRALSGKKDQTAEIDRLNKEIKKIMDEKSPRLAQGRLLYDKVVANENMGKWRLDDVEKFIEYYTATNYRVVNRLQSIPRRDELTPHRLLYLILVEMKKTDQQICFIQGITKECLRVYRFRTQPIEKEETSEESDESL